jgi:hypothetical protein
MKPKEILITNIKGLVQVRDATPSFVSGRIRRIFPFRTMLFF